MPVVLEVDHVIERSPFPLEAGAGCVEAARLQEGADIADISAS
jgi:hypothetical protein